MLLEPLGFDPFRRSTAVDPLVESVEMATVPLAEDGPSALSYLSEPDPAEPSTRLHPEPFGSAREDPGVELALLHVGALANGVAC